MRTLRHALILGVLVTAAGCDTPREFVGEGYGDANLHNAAAMVVNPDPPLADAAAPELDGVRGKLANDRYQINRVIPPREQRTTTLAVGASSSGGQGK